MFLYGGPFVLPATEAFYSKYVGKNRLSITHINKTSVNQNKKDCFIFVFVETSYNCYLE